MGRYLTEYEAFINEIQITCGDDYLRRLNFFVNSVDMNTLDFDDLISKIRRMEISTRLDLLKLAKLRKKNEAYRNLLIVTEVVRKEYINTLNYRINVNTLNDYLSKLPISWVRMMANEIANDGLNDRTEFLTEEERNNILDKISAYTHETYIREEEKKTLN